MCSHTAYWTSEANISIMTLCSTYRKYYFVAVVAAEHTMIDIPDAKHTAANTQTHTRAHIHAHTSLFK